MSNLQRKGTKGFTTGLVVILGTFCTYHANAAVLEEITVTAQKREQNIRDVGISMSAFSGDQLFQLGMTNTIDLARMTPALTFSQEHPTLTALTIRGVSQRDLADHHEPPVATYVDGAYVSSMGAAHVQMFDLERVEVLRGPQGTLFGRNSTGGVLHYISRKPTSEFDVYGELTFAEYSQLTFEGAIGGPITENILGRFSVATDHHDGWMENRIGKDMNDAGTYTGRGQLLFKLGEKTELLLKIYDTEDDTTSPGYNHTPNTYKPDGLGYSVGRDELATFLDFAGNPFQTCPGCDAHWYREPDADPRTGSFDVIGDFDRSITGSDATLTIDFGSMTLTSITDYLHMDKSILEDVDGSPQTSVNFYTDQDLGQFSQELRLSGESERLSWITGFYYLNIDNHTESGLAPINIAPFIGLNFPGAFVPYNTGFVAQTDAQSWAVFGHLEYAINDQWSVVAALRYTEDDKEADYTLTDDAGLVQHFNKQTSPNAKLAFENVSAKAALNWKPVENTLIYASYNRGHKAGSFNYPFIGPITDFSTLSHDEEVLNSYELGYKGDFQDGRTRLNVDFFYYDYNNYQAAFFVNFANLVGNVDATAHGGELELFMSPTDQLELVLGASWLDAKSKDVGMPDGSIQDRYMANAPHFTLNGLARYTWPLANGNVAIQVDGYYSDNFCFSVVCNYSEREDSYFISNARISYTTGDEKWSFTAFVRNLTDTTYRVYTTDSAFVGFHTNMPNPPRWFGGTIAYHWR